MVGLSNLVVYLKRSCSPVYQYAYECPVANGSVGSLDYAKLDPYLSRDQLHDYRQSEADWRAVMEKALRKPGWEGSLQIPPRPTFVQFEALRHMIGQRDDVGLKILPSHKKDGRLQEGFTKFSPKENRPVISFYLPDSSDPDDIASSFLTLSHEFVHALHFNRASVRPQERRANFDLCTSRMEGLIERHCKSRPDWAALFRNDETVQYELKRLPVKSLGALKVKLLTEAAAYDLASNNCNLFDKGMAQGYKEAIRAINVKIEEKQRGGAACLVSRKRQRIH